ncbi:mRNA turnover protein 4 [Thelohanellus kitauei]|uniref:mRNA turnover protein 4 n=1 Tax=Thelohanellus kitauei TaxID=669202 RepID=A0A0C2M3B9_THEKT|nr:mRNA turnover protein 4 [Thelohanellus kitauei]
MAKNKASKPVSLTATKKVPRKVRKACLKEKISQNLEDYSSVYVFSVDDMRNSKLKNVRESLRDSRIFFGNNKIIAVALGRTAEEEAGQNLHQLSQVVFPLISDYDQLKFTMQPLLRKLKLPASVNQGIIHLDETVEVCKEGDIITPEQSSILKLFGHKIATFKINLIASWHKDKGGKIKTY